MEEKEFMQKIEEIRKHLQEHLKKERYEHSLSVAFTSICLAMAHGVDLQKAELAGLCHDCAKYMGKKELLEACQRDHIPLLPEYLEAPQVLHGIYGACYAKKHFQIDNEEILSAIYYHTLGKPAMTTLEKIVYLDDYIEVRRGNREDLTAIREIAFKDLDLAVKLCLEASIAYVKEKGQHCCSLSLDALAYYQEKKEV